MIHGIDENGWLNTDEKLPANMEVVLIWNDEVDAVQFAEFKMYSMKRYEFVQGNDVVSIYNVTHWQSVPKRPTETIITV